MAYAQAIYDGSVTLDGVTAQRVGTPDEVAGEIEKRRAIPVLGSADPALLTRLRPSVIVDARMRKKERSTSRIIDAPLVIGLGPGFKAGVEAHVVIETNRGPNLGRIITEGEADAYTGEPLEIAGHSKDRYLYAPRAGVFHTAHDLGDQVEAGQLVGAVDDEALTAKVGGIIRGIVKSGLPVAEGAKLVDIDPRRQESALSEISQKAWRIADAVLSVIRDRDKNGSVAR
jgi:xanthine dehydrogenase accessory factor